MDIHPILPQKKLRLVIHGRVQGVFFRDSMLREAQKLGICGWVRNRSDGSIEAAVQGNPDAVDAIMGWARHLRMWSESESSKMMVATTGFEIIG